MKTLLLTSTYGPLLGHTIIEHTVDPEDIFLDFAHIPELHMNKFPLSITFATEPTNDRLDAVPNKPCILEAPWSFFRTYTPHILVHKIRASQWIGLPFIHILLTIEDRSDVAALERIVLSAPNQHITLDPSTPELLRECADHLQPEWSIRMRPLLIQYITPKEPPIENTESKPTYRSEGPRRGRTPQV